MLSSICGILYPPYHHLNDVLIVAVVVAIHQNQKLQTLDAYRSEISTYFEIIAFCSKN